MDIKKLLLAREQFINLYCEEKGWDREILNWEQIAEIRTQDGWKEPTLFTIEKHPQVGFSTILPEIRGEKIK